MRARATEPRVIDAPRGEIVSEYPSQLPARSLRKLMRDRVVIRDGIVAEFPSATAGLSLRQMHDSRPGDLGAAVP